MTTNELARLAVWYNHLRDTSNDTFMPLFSCESRYLVLKGGGGSGKSIFAGRKVLERCVSEPGHRFLVCRKVARTLRESCFAQLRGQISEHYPDSGAVVNRGELRIVFPNGSEILFAGLDDVEKLKSIYDITGIWIEEAPELLESDFNQLDIRLRTQCPYYLLEAANSVRRCDSEFRRYYDLKFKEVNKYQHKRALALTARKLVRLVFRLLKDNRLYIPPEG